MSRKSRKRNREKRWGFYGTDEWRALRKNVIKKYGKNCMCCGRYSERPHVDHIKPRSKYPELALTFSNMQVLCKTCNFRKGAHHSHDFRKRWERQKQSERKLTMIIEHDQLGPDEAAHMRSIIHGL